MMVVVLTKSDNKREEAAAPPPPATTTPPGTATKRNAFNIKFDGSLGIQIGDEGVIEDVSPGSSAEEGGVIVGDTIAYIDGVPLSHMFAHTDTPNAREVGAALNRAKRQQGYVAVRFRPGKV